MEASTWRRPAPPPIIDSVLKVTGPAEDRDRFRQAVSFVTWSGEELPLVIDTLVPCPVGYTRDEARQWRVRHWGTADNTRFSRHQPTRTEDGETLTYHLATEDDGIHMWVLTVAPWFPELDFLYVCASEAAGIARVISVRAGEVTERWGGKVGPEKVRELFPSSRAPGTDGGQPPA